MSIENGKLWISFNGEIFNYIELREELVRKGHRFATRSDTEVILHLYREEGEDCVRRLNGQWAFAIWDSEQQKLFLSRDRFGVRPLFYTHSDARFLFASEIKSLLTWTEVDAELDLRALDQIFTVWVTIPPRTAFRNILQLPPGHSLVVKDGKIEIRQYWRLEYAPENEGAQGTEKKLAEELLSLLLDATRIRLRSDVPVGAYLSGGLDSTLITALTKSLVGERLRTFSISFEDPTFDESPYQREASAFFGTQHSDVRCSYENIARIFPDVIWHCEQPILRTAPVPMFLLARLVRESGFKVVLTGEGADETMGGYDVFKEAKIRRFWARHPESRIRPMLLKRLYPYMDAMQRQPAAYLKTFFRITDEDLGSPFFSHLPRWELTARLKAFFSEEVRKELEFYTTTDDLARELPSNYGSWSAFNQAEFLEAQYLMPGYILSSQGDRMAMAHSVEGRYPFLDYRLVVEALAAATPLPLSVDSERLYADDLAGVAETVRLLAEAGAAGCSIEDYDPAAKRLDDPRRRRARGRRGRGGTPAGLVLTARAENHLYGVDDLDDDRAAARLPRGRRRRRLRARPARPRRDRGRRRGDDTPVNVLVFPGSPSVAELGALGVRRVSTGGALARAAYGTLMAAARELRGPGTAEYARGGLSAEERAAAFDSR